MAYEPVQSPDVLWEGPLFADEVGWSQRITSSLREQFDLQSLRVIPAKEAMEGVVSIYFRPQHRNWALVRYAQRYRWIFDTLLRQGMSGERRLIDYEFTPEDIEFLYDIVPYSPEDIDPPVYDILWRSVPYPQYVAVVSAINGSTVFKPKDILNRNSDVSSDDVFVFQRLVRNHLIERPNRASSYNSSPRSKNTISVDLDASYRLTEEGKDAIPKIVSEHDRIFVREEFDPLLINEELDPDGHLPEPTGMTDQDEELRKDSPEPKSESDDILEEIEQEIEMFRNESSD